MRKHIIFICTFLLSILFEAAAQQPSQVDQRKALMEQKADSAIANRMVKQMLALFELTKVQQEELYRAGVAININRRQVFKTHWNTPAFVTEMAKVDSAADLQYRAITGSDNYRLYKDVLSADIVRKQAIMQQRAALHKKDSIITKPNNP